MSIAAASSATALRDSKQRAGSSAISSISRASDASSAVNEVFPAEWIRTASRPIRQITPAHAAVEPMSSIDDGAITA